MAAVLKCHPNLHFAVSAILGTSAPSAICSFWILAAPTFNALKHP